MDIQRVVVELSETGHRVLDAALVDEDELLQGIRGD
jgi:hypothetical protein